MAIMRRSKQARSNTQYHLLTLYQKWHKLSSFSANLHKNSDNAININCIFCANCHTLPCCNVKKFVAIGKYICTQKTSPHFLRYGFSRKKLPEIQRFKKHITANVLAAIAKCSKNAEQKIRMSRKMMKAYLLYGEEDDADRRILCLHY